ncbi:hypothetical protein A2U01_0020202, partial [Trifolium medium]|nr:hypothetical protein [Trifolium medium]
TQPLDFVKILDLSFAMSKGAVKYCPDGAALSSELCFFIHGDMKDAHVEVE